MIAYCWRSGPIGFGEQMPKGCLPLAHNVNKEMRERIEGNARLTYDGKTYLVPGLPEAKDSATALAALEEFRRRVGSDLS